MTVTKLSSPQRQYFDKIGNMEIKSAVKALSALAQDTRLAAFRSLVKAGPAGLAAGTLAESLGVANATLSFHLKEMTHAGLLVPRQEGRFIYYSANFEQMNDLLAFLTENCCAGSECEVSSPLVCCPEKTS